MTELRKRMQGNKGPCLAVVAGLAVLPSIALADNWKCEVKAAYRITASGELKPHPYPNVLGGGEIGDVFYFDERSETVRLFSKRHDKDVWELAFKTWQFASKENHAIGVFLNKGPASNPVMVIRVFAFDRPIRFAFYDEDGDISSGLCVAVAPR